MHTGSWSSAPRPALERDAQAVADVDLEAFRQPRAGREPGEHLAATGAGLAGQVAGAPPANRPAGRDDGRGLDVEQGLSRIGVQRFPVWAGELSGADAGDRLGLVVEVGLFQHEAVLAWVQPQPLLG